MKLSQTKCPIYIKNVLSPLHPSPTPHTPVKYLEDELATVADRITRIEIIKEMDIKVEEEMKNNLWMQTLNTGKKSIKTWNDPIKCDHNSRVFSWAVTGGDSPSSYTAETLTVYKVCEVRSLRGMLVRDLSTSTYNRAAELFLQRVEFGHLSAVDWNSRYKSIRIVVPKKAMFSNLHETRNETVPMFLKWKKEVCTRAISDTVNDDCLRIQTTESFFKGFTLYHCLLSFGNVVLCIIWFAMHKNPVRPTGHCTSFEIETHDEVNVCTWIN